MANLTLTNVKCKFCSQGFDYSKCVHSSGKFFCSEFCIDMYLERNER